MSAPVTTSDLRVETSPDQKPVRFLVVGRDGQASTAFTEAQVREALAQWDKLAAQPMPEPEPVPDEKVSEPVSAYRGRTHRTR